MVTVYTALYSMGDSVYYPIFSTARIYACVVESIYLRNSIIYYDLVRSDNGQGILAVPETEVLSFASARSSLLAYLTAKTTEITNLTA